jgi:hypothetical protein
MKVSRSVDNRLHKAAEGELPTFRGRQCLDRSAAEAVVQTLLSRDVL